MAAKMICEKSTVTAVANSIITVYTVPSGKAARVRIMFAFVNDGTHTSISLFVGSDSSQCIAKHGIPANVDFWTGMKSSDNNNDQSNYPGMIGMHQVDLGGSISYQDNHQPYLLAPFPVDYYLEAGDKVRFGDSAQTTSNLADTLFYVMGVEDDA